jgi:hypothetical protein
MGLRKYKIILQMIQQQMTPVPGAPSCRHNGFPII